MSNMATFMPRPASLRAEASPRPEAPPVTTAEIPDSSFIAFSFFTQFLVCAQTSQKPPYHKTKLGKLENITCNIHILPMTDDEGPKNSNVIFGEILEPGDDDHQQGRQKNVRDKFWQTARRAAGKVPFMDEVVAVYFCAMDPQTPTKVRGIMLAALAYFIMPIDLVPDFLAVVGFGDDVAVLSAVIAALRPNITDEHRSAAKKALADNLENPKE